METLPMFPNLYYTLNVEACEIGDLEAYPWLLHVNMQAMPMYVDERSIALPAAQGIGSAPTRYVRVDASLFSAQEALTSLINVFSSIKPSTLFFSSVNDCVIK